MSKASEWAAQEQEKRKRHDSAPAFYVDRYPLENGSSLRRVAGVELTGSFGNRHRLIFTGAVPDLSPGECAKFGRWLLDTFGEGEPTDADAATGRGAE